MTLDLFSEEYAVFFMYLFHSKLYVVSKVTLLCDVVDIGRLTIFSTTMLTGKRFGMGNGRISVGFC